MLADLFKKTRKFIRPARRKEGWHTWLRVGRGEREGEKNVCSYKKQLGLKLWSSSFSFSHAKVQIYHQVADGRIACRGYWHFGYPRVSFICHLCLLSFVYLTNLTWHNKGMATRSKRHCLNILYSAWKKKREREKDRSAESSILLIFIGGGGKHLGTKEVGIIITRLCMNS